MVKSRAVEGSKGLPWGGGGGGGGFGGRWVPKLGRTPGRQVRGGGGSRVVELRGRKADDAWGWSIKRILRQKATA